MVRFYRVLFTVVLVAILALPTAVADDTWSIRAGAAAAGTVIYDGSDDYVSAVLPEVEVAYSRERISLSTSVMDGIGVTFFDPGRGQLVSASVNVGSSRLREWNGVLSAPGSYSDRAKRRLSDTPNVEEFVAVDLTAGYLTPVGVVGAVVGYRPARVDPPADRGRDRIEQGLLLSAMYLLPLPIGDRGAVEAIVLFDLMNESYADAWYALPYETDEHSRFDAVAGLRSVRAILGFEHIFASNLGVGAQLGGTVLLGDAADSPFTVSRVQSSLVISTFYSFG